MSEISFLLCLVFITVIFTLRFCRLHDRIRELEKQIDKIGIDMDCMCDHVWYCVEHINYINADLKRKEEETK